MKSMEILVIDLMEKIIALKASVVANSIICATMLKGMTTGWICHGSKHYLNTYCLKATLTKVARF